VFSTRTVRNGAVTTVEVSGAVDIGSYVRFGQELDRVLADRPATLVVDLLAVTVMDSHGFAELIGVRNELSESSTTRLVIGPRPHRVARMFDLMHLRDSFEFDPPFDDG
jgi:anti-sigma B factor antagonist